MLVLKSTMEKEVNRLENEVKRAGKYIVDMATDFEKERNQLLEEIDRLREHSMNQEWYRETWAEMVNRQNNIMEDQVNALKSIASEIRK